MPEPTEVDSRIVNQWGSRDLYPSFSKEDEEGEKQGWLPSLYHKEVTRPEEGASAQEVNIGEQVHPFDMTAVTNFQIVNEHHSTCIATKTAATVGLGFLTPEDLKKRQAGAPAPASGSQQPLDAASGGLMPLLNRAEKWKPTKADEVLDPLCEHSFQDLLNQCCEDYHCIANGAIEVIRKGSAGDDDKITGLHWLPFRHARLFIEDYSYNSHWVIRSPEGTDRIFAHFGQKQSLLKRIASNSFTTLSSAAASREGAGTDSISELIFFRRPSALHRWYGVPKWLSATAVIELVQMLTQFKFDFFLNRCTPEFMLFAIGAILGKEDWSKVTSALQGGIGMGNSHKSIALNLAANPNEFKVQLEKLAAESGKEDSWGKDNEACAFRIVTAHQVPPLLAGIQIPGKLGATNELPNAMMAFQALVIGQDQRLFERKLSSTLGNGKVNGGLPLKPEDFVCRTILDEVDIGQADTIGRMRQTVPEARAAGRDLNAGVKD